jgi:2-methylcitrate dehydratase PrpD
MAFSHKTSTALRSRPTPARCGSPTGWSRSFTDIQLSIPYCLGLVALGGREALLPVSAGALGRSEVVDIARKVSLRLDAELDRRFPAETLCRVSVRVGDRGFVSPVTAPRGEASDPPPWSDLEEKLRIASLFVASPAQQDAPVALPVIAGSAIRSAEQKRRRQTEM